jgi:hypothetical protein
MVKEAAALPESLMATRRDSAKLCEAVVKLAFDEHPCELQTYRVESALLAVFSVRRITYILTFQRFS